MKKVLSLIIMITLAFSIAACALIPEKTKVYDTHFGKVCDVSGPRTTMELIENRFPSLEGATDVYYESMRMYQGESRLPAPSDYVVCGYITLTDEAAEKYASSYEWEAASPETSFISIESREGDWKSSEEFKKDIIPTQYWGHMYLSGNTLLFEWSDENVTSS